MLCIRSGEERFVKLSPSHHSILITIPISTTYFIYIYYFYGRYYEPIDYDYVDQHYQCEPGQGIDK